MTVTGQFIGSLFWASPEQAEGAPSKIDMRTDVYSLGVILFHMLTGRFPYDVTGSIDEVLSRIRHESPVHPRSLRREIDDELETIVLKCLSKERERRYQSAGELARDIEHYLRGEPIEAKRDSGFYLLRKSLSRHRRELTVASAFALMLLVVTGVYLWNHGKERARAVDQESRALWTEAARLLRERRDLETAERKLTAALRLRPDGEEAHLHMGALNVQRALDAPIESRDAFVQAAMASFQAAHESVGGAPFDLLIGGSPRKATSGAGGSPAALRAAAELIRLTGWKGSTSAMAVADPGQVAIDFVRVAEVIEAVNPVVASIAPAEMYYTRFTDDPLYCSDPPSEIPDDAKTAADRSAEITWMLTWSSDVRSLDPRDESYICDLVFDSLVQADENGRPDWNGAIVEGQPAASEDRLTWTVLLKDGLAWHDGSPLTADDFKSAWDDLDSKYRAEVYLESVVARERLHLEFTFSKALSRDSALWSMGSILIPPDITLPRDANGDAARRSDRHLRTISKKCNGPFRVAGFRPDRIELQRWDGYLGQRPFIDRITFRVETDRHRRLRLLADDVVQVMELDADDFRWHVNGGQYVDERVASFDDATGEFTYYLSNDIFSVVGTGAADGTVTSTFTYGAYGKPTVNPVIGTCTRGDVNEDGFVNGGDLAPFLNVLFGIDTDPAHICAADIDGNGVVDFTDSELLDCCILAGGCDNICSPGDIDQDGDVDKADQALFIGLVCDPSTGDAAELCAADVNQDGIVNGGDIQSFIFCIKGIFCPPPLGGTFESGPGTTDSTFFLHGRIVDFIDPDPGTGLPRLVLQFNRARYYDVSNGRWLQRDPAGFQDGPNLYESFRGLPGRNRDPLGEDTLEEIFDLFHRYGREEGIRQTLDEQLGATPLDPITAASRERERIIIGTLGPPAKQAVEISRQVAVRGGGGLGAVGGVAETAIGVVLFVPSFGTSTVFIAHGGDVAQAGVRQSASGEAVPTFTFQVLSESGHPTLALVVDVGTSLGSGGAGLLASARSATTGIRALSATTEIANIGTEARVLGRGSPFFARLQGANQRIAALLFDRRPGEVVLGSGISPGPISGTQLLFPFAETTRGGTLPVRIGQAGVQETVLQLTRAGFKIRSSEVTFETLAARTRLDLFVEAPPTGSIIPGTGIPAQGGQLFFVEVKTGTGQLTINQKLAIPQIERFGGIPRGLRAEEALLNVGQQQGPFEVIIIRRP